MSSYSHLVSLAAAVALTMAGAGSVHAQGDGPVTSPTQVEAPAEPASAPAATPTTAAARKRAAAAKAKQAAAAARARKAAAAKKQQAARAKKTKAAAAKKQAAAAAKKKLALAKKKPTAKQKLAARKRAGAKPSSAARTTRTAAAAVGESRRNMPVGWDWPPTDAMAATGARCTAELDARGIAWKPAPTEPKVATPIVIPAMELGGVKLVSTFRKGPHVMDCHLALALAIHGEHLYALGVRELGFSRIYGYTNVVVDGVTRNVLSRHALGLAIDFRWFADALGRKAMVLEDYPQHDPLLLAVEAYLNHSGGFRTVLTPRNDPDSHDDHFHVEARVEYRADPP